MQVQYEPWGFRDENQKIDLWGFKLLDGDFAGTTISINDLEMDDSNPELKLDYTVIRKPDNKTDEEMQSVAMQEVFSYVVNDILRKAINEWENRDSNTSESNQ